MPSALLRTRQRLEVDASESRAILSHALSKGPVNRILTVNDLTNVLTYTAIPKPTEQADNLLRYLGEKLKGIGDGFSLSKESDELKVIGARIGSRIGSEWEDFQALASELFEQGLLRLEVSLTASHTMKNFKSIWLSLSGWDKYEELYRSIRSRTAFVAMKFKIDDSENYFFQDELLPNHLVTAVRQAGFALGNPLAENPQAGNLHARLELEIKNARLTVAELSHHNNGAYWEAGFAKGLGKPVIYMYNKEIGGGPRPHFDVLRSDYLLGGRKPGHRRSVLRT